MALKFPAPVPVATAAAERPIGGKAWHVDGFGQGQHSPFTLLVGVCLSAVSADGCGNFAVHPGAHWALQEEVKRTVQANDTLFSGFEHDARKPDLGEPVQLHLSPGDCVLATQKLPHLGCGNKSPNIRYQVYFRLRHVDLEHHKEAWLDDLYLPFEGVREAVESAH